MILSVGSRDSELAQNQTEYVIDLLEDEADVRAELLTEKSTGDEHPEEDPGELDEIGIYTSRLDRKLIDGQYDIVVHSLKDCPTDRPDPLELAAIPPRTTPFDVLVGSLENKFSDLDDDTVIGTSSDRRKANVLYSNSNLDIKSCRGNVPTRLDKLESDDTPFDALILAAAGLERLDLSPRSRMIKRDEIIPAAGQGALAVMCRSDNEKVLEQIKQINHEPSELVCRAERSFLSTLEGGCEAPIGALARIKNDTLTLYGSVTQKQGKERIEDTISGSTNEVEKLGRQLANEVLDEGAGSFLKR